MFSVIEALSDRTPAETNLELTTEPEMGLKLASVLADVVKLWVRGSAISVDIQPVVEALGRPFTIIGQHHCAAEALGRMLQLLDAGINKYFPEVMLLDKRAKCPQAKAAKLAQNTEQPHSKYACLHAAVLLRVCNRLWGCDQEV